MTMSSFWERFIACRPVRRTALLVFAALLAAGSPTRAEGDLGEPVQVYRSGEMTLEVFATEGGAELTVLASNASPDVLDLAVTFQLENMRAEANPARRLLQPRRLRQPVTVLRRERPDLPFRHSMQLTVYYGDPAAVPSGFYEPPIAPGARFGVANAFFGSGAHASLTPHAVDIPMPEGTPIHAARTGVVVRVRDDSDRGGPDPAFAADANYVIVLHSDGTYGNYVHLKKGGSLVKPGLLVLAGRPLGLSGNTGWSTAPHLHFHVSRADGRGGFSTVPWQFLIGGKGVTPTVGMVITR